MKTKSGNTWELGEQIGNIIEKLLRTRWEHGGNTKIYKNSKPNLVNPNVEVINNIISTWLTNIGYKKARVFIIKTFI
jgi:hypothetical protein